MLLPNSSETKIWHSHILGKARIWKPNKRINFENPSLEKQKGSSFTTVIVELTKQECKEYEMIRVEDYIGLDELTSKGEIEAYLSGINEDKVKQLELFI